MRQKGFWLQSWTLKRPCMNCWCTSGWSMGRRDIVKRYFLYSSVSSPLVRSKRFTLFALPDRPVHSDTVLGFSGKHSSQAAITRQTKSLTFPPLSIARYSFIQLSQQGRREENENAQSSKRYQRGFEPGLTRLRVRRSTTELPRSTLWHRSITGNV